MNAEEHRLIDYKQRHLPVQLARARKKVKRLEAECIKYGMKELLEKPEVINQLWEREVVRAREEGMRGSEPVEPKPDPLVAAIMEARG